MRAPKLRYFQSVLNFLVPFRNQMSVRTILLLKCSLKGSILERGIMMRRKSNCGTIPQFTNQIQKACSKIHCFLSWIHLLMKALCVRVRRAKEKIRATQPHWKMRRTKRPKRKLKDFSVRSLHSLQNYFNQSTILLVHSQSEFIPLAILYD